MVDAHYFSENINYNNYTRLPCKTFVKADRANPVIEVRTPHKGIVFIEIKKVESGMFKPSCEVDRSTNSVIDQLHALEDEAKNHLLSKWVQFGSI